MDIIFHICLFVILAALFFIYKFHDSQNPMLFTILIAILGLVALYQDTTYITTGWNATSEYNYTTHTATSETYPIKENFAFEWMLYLAYFAFFITSVVQLGTGEEFRKQK